MGGGGGGLIPILTDFQHCVCENKRMQAKERGKAKVVFLLTAGDNPFNTVYVRVIM